MCLAFPGPAVIQLPGRGESWLSSPGERRELNALPSACGALRAFSQSAEFLKYPASAAVPGWDLSGVIAGGSRSLPRQGFLQRGCCSWGDFSPLCANQFGFIRGYLEVCVQAMLSLLGVAGWARGWP